ncbi:MAG: hypothetical protein ABW321_36055 [Polyangiales bacterium]
MLELLLHVGLLAAFSVYYAFQCTAGTFGTLVWRTEYYNLAAEGFRLGQLALPVTPHPMLLAQPNPYDPALRTLWLWDAILWQGRYFIYWGPVPALCLLAWKTLAGYADKVVDQWLVLAFMLGRLYAGAGLIWSLARQANRPAPVWASALAVSVFALASPTPFVMVRPLIYEACIAAGQCFLFMGLLAAFWSVRTRSVWLAVLAGLAWSCAFNSRVTWLPVAPLLAATCAWFWYRSGARSVRNGVKALAAFGVPVGLGLAAAGAYNYARFGSPTDFGVAHQLTGRPFTSDPRFALPNLYSYLFAEMDWSCTFPFVQVSVNRVLPGFITWPPDYDLGGWLLGERVSGLFVTVPFCYLAFGLLLRPLWNGWLRLHGLPGIRVHMLSRAQACLAVCALACLPSLLPALGGYTASMRYLEDASGAAVLFACIVGFRWIRAPERVLRWSGRAAFTLLALFSIAVGVGLGFSGFVGNFQRENPVLHYKLVQSLSMCQRLP